MHGTSSCGRRATLVGLILICTVIFAQNSQPTLLETLQWLHNAFPDSQSASEFRLGQTREFIFVEGKANASPSCVVTIVEHWKTDGKPRTRETIIDLSLIDPESIKWFTDDILDKNMGELMMVTTNDKKNIVEKLKGEKDDKPYFSKEIFMSFIGPDYAQRFAKAFRNAVTLCGGKPSTF